MSLKTDTQRKTEMYRKINCVKAYDIRGRLGDELDEDVAYRIGRAFGQYQQAKTVVVGGDVRATSESLKLALANGLDGCRCRCDRPWHDWY